MYVLLLIFLCLVSYGQVHATSLTVGGMPESADSYEPLAVDVSFSGSKGSCANKIYYLRGAFFHEGSADYFGFTFNHNNEWVENPSLKTEYFQFTTDSEGSWSGKLFVQPNPSDDSYDGPGNYSFKVGRYTENGASVTEWSNILSILLTQAATPPPSPSPTPLPATPDPTLQPTANPTPTPKPTPIHYPNPALRTPQATPLPSPSARITAAAATNRTAVSPPATPAVQENSNLSEISVGSVAGYTDNITPTAGTALKSEGKVSKTSAVVTVLGGVLILAGSLVLGMKFMKSDTIDQ